MTFLTNPINYHLGSFSKIAFGKLDEWRNDIIKANGFIAIGANKMYMIIMMVSFSTVLAKGIAYRIIGSGNGMNDSFFNKGLECAVNSYPVEFFSGFFFDISMGQRIGCRQK